MSSQTYTITIIQALTFTVKILLTVFHLGHGLELAPIKLQI